MANTLNFSLKIKIKSLADVLKSVGDKIDNEKKKAEKPFSLKLNTKDLFADFAKIGLAIDGVKKVASTIFKIEEPFLKYQAGLKNLNTLINVSESELATYGKRIKELGIITGNIEQVNNGAWLAVSKLGKEVLSNAQFMNSMARSSVAGKASIEESISLTSNIIKSMGLEITDSEKIMNQAFQTVKYGDTNFRDLAHSIGGVSPLANAAGIKLGELNSIYATLTGVTGDTSVVTTQAKAALSNIIKPSEKAIQTAKSLGIEFSASAIKTMGFTKFLQQLKEETGGNIATLGKLFESTEALNAMTALTSSQYDTFNEKLALIRDSSGAMNDAFETQADSLEYKQQKMMASIEAMSISFVELFAPIITNVVEGITKVFSVIEDNITIMTVWAGVIVSSILAFKGVVIATKLWTVAQTIHNAVMNANPIGLIITGIGVLIGIIYTVVDKTIGWSKAWEYVKASMLIAWEYIKAFGDYLVNFGKSSVQLLTYPYTVLARTVVSVFGNIKEMLQKLFTGDFKGFATLIADSFKTSFAQTNASIQSGFNNSMTSFTGLGEKAKKIWKEAGKVAQEAMTQSVVNKTNKPENNANKGEVSVIIPSDEEIAKAKAAIDDFFLSIKSKREQLKADYESKKSIIELAYFNNPEGLKTKLSELDTWYASENDKFRKAEIEKEKEQYQKTIKILEAKKQLGLDVTEELRNTQAEYTEWLKTTYGADSEAYLNALNEKKQASEKLWQANNRMVTSAIDSIAKGFRTAWGTILDTEMTGKQRREAIWESMKQSFFGTVGDMAKEWIKKQLLKMAMSKTAGAVERTEAVKTAAVEKVSILSTIALKVKSALASIGGAVAGGLKWLVSKLGPVGLGLGIALGAGIVAAFNGIRKKLGFKTGGYTGDGDKNEEAGVVHKEEVVFESEITKPNLADLLGLRKLLQKGYRLKELLMPTIQLPQVSLPEPQFAYSSGGYVSGSGDNSILNEILEAIKESKSAESLQVILKGEPDLIAMYRLHLKAKAAYTRAGLGD